MIKLIPATLSGTTPSIYEVEIDETLCQGFDVTNLPTAVVSVVNNGSFVAAGGTTMQKLTFAVTVTYQPCQNSSSTRIKAFAETATVAVPGTATSVTPTINASSTVLANKFVCCGNRAKGVRILTSVSVAYA